MDRWLAIKGGNEKESALAQRLLSSIRDPDYGLYSGLLLVGLTAICVLVLEPFGAEQVGATLNVQSASAAGPSN